MDTANALLLNYFSEQLLGNENLRPYLTESSVLVTGQDPQLVRDIMVLMPDELFENDFRLSFGGCFVVDDHDQTPPRPGDQGFEDRVPHSLRRSGDDSRGRTFRAADGRRGLLQKDRRHRGVGEEDRFTSLGLGYFFPDASVGTPTALARRSLLARPGFLRFLRCGCGFSSSGFEAFNPPGGVYEFLFAGVEGVALGADINAYLRPGGADRERIAAGAAHLGFREILRMNIFGHNRVHPIVSSTPRYEPICARPRSDDEGVLPVLQGGATQVLRKLAISLRVPPVLPPGFVARRSCSSPATNLLLAPCRKPKPGRNAVGKILLDGLRLLYTLGL